MSGQEATQEFTGHAGHQAQDRTYNVLFLDSGNSARSVMAEAVLNELGGGRFRAYSAGSNPTGKVSPFTIELMRTNGLPTDALRSKSWDEFGRPDAPEMDFVITLCDRAAGEACPVWPGHPVTAFWGFEDPACAQGSDEEKWDKFRHVYEQIAARVRLLINLPLPRLDHLARESEVRELATPSHERS
ncbi:MAG TPA: arsenate reductase ArsC [Burkholderiales bacterium]|nr:arsenate reductase ArsC [Burkholderiales bacterium]